MDIRTFRASTLQEALEQVRETLGPDAAVLHTREVKRSRLGLFSSRLVEVEASIEMPTVNRLAKQTVDTQKPANMRASVASALVVGSSELDVAQAKTVPAVAAVAQPQVRSNEPSVKLQPEPVAATADSLLLPSQSLQARSTKARQSFGGLSKSVFDSEPTANSLSSTSSALYSNMHSPAMVDAIATMLDAGVDPNIAKQLMQTAVEHLSDEQVNDALLLQGQIVQLVGKSLRVAEPLAVTHGEQAVVAMIGSTGVGKTTTLAKIAKNLQVDQSCEIGLLTMDIFRPGAVDQLLQYAESLDATVEVVSSAHQFTTALQRLKHCDIVFIDTAGRSPNDPEQIQILQEILDAAQPTSVQLVVSATSSTSHVKLAVQQFAPLHPTGLVITKLDEAIEFGSWLSVLQQIELPVSYIGHGQQVPRDIMPANRRRLANFLLGHAAQPQTGE